MAKGNISKARKKVERVLPWDETPYGKPAVGIDPGSRNTGFIVIQGEVILYSATIKRDDVMTAVEYAYTVVDEIKNVLDTLSVFETNDIRIGIEGISDPKGFQNGKRSPINPKDIIRAGIVVGAVSVALREYNPIIIAPGGNGSNHPSQYPPSLQGRRPTDLPGSGGGSGTRNHEQSAYDVAVKANEQFKLQGE